MKFFYLMASILVAFSATVTSASDYSPYNSLEISGALEDERYHAPILVDIAALKALPQMQITTHNPWNEGLHTYTGFNPIDLLKTLKSEGDVLRFKALNQYITEIPISDFAKQHALIAYEKDYRPISVRDKGPFLVIYDFDGDETLRNETFYGRSIWQIKSIEVLRNGEF